jgi:hypothetical protein
MAQQRIFNGVALTDDELAICRQLGNDPAEFARRLADRRAGRPMIPSRQSRKENPTGLIGPQIVDEAFAEHHKELESPSVDHRQLVQEARKALDEFDRKAAAPDAWKILARDGDADRRARSNRAGLRGPGQSPGEHAG